MSESNNRRSNKSKKSEKKAKKKNRIVLFFQVAFLIAIVLGFVGLGVTAGIVKAALKDVQPVDPSRIPSRLDENSVIYDSNGNILEKIQSDGLRTVVKYEDIDEDLKNAFLATEDRTFFDHKGFNFKRLVGAAIEGLKTRSMPKGTSTITQQLARNIYLAEIKSEKTLTRKIKEAYYAIQIENALLKEQIFEAYLNTIYLGSGAKGVQAAAQTYFSKDAKDLDLVESALIAGITSSPLKNAPITTIRKDKVTEEHYILDDSSEMYTIVFNNSCIDRYKAVLSFMKTEGYITEAQYEEAKNVDLKTKLKPGKLKNTDISSFFTDMVKDEVIDSLMAEMDITREEATNMLYTQGLNIYSTLDLDMQTKLENIYVNNKNFPLLSLRKDGAGNVKGTTGSIILYKKENIITNDNNLKLFKNEFKYNDNGDLVLLKNRKLDFIPIKEDEKLISIQIKLSDTYAVNDAKEMFIYKGGSVKIPSQFKSFDNQKNLVINSEFLNSNPEFFKKDGEGNLLVSNENYSISSKGTVQPQSSTVIIDYRTGAVKALIGGRNITGQKQYNRALSPRQPGSTIKPIAIYTPALDNGWTAASIIDDIPHYDAKGRRWPKNWYNHQEYPYRGLMTLRYAVQWSTNVPSVIVSERIGVSTSIEYLKKMGITSLVESGPRTDTNSAAMALGGMTRGISPLELTAAFGSLANNGVHIKPYSFTKITDRNGNIIIDNKQQKNLVVNPQVAFLITDIMRSGVEEQGVATRARLKQNIPVAGKTGTTSDKIDAWFVGYTPYYVAGVWIGNDLQTPLPNGSILGAQLWKKIMDEIHEGLPNKNFERPDGIITKMIDTKSGKLATDLSKEAGDVRNEYFIKGTEPTEYDDVHVKAVVCSESGKLATSYCPDESIGSQIFIRRPVPYNPEEHGGIVPRDYGEPPTEYCDIHTSNYNNNNIPSIDDLPLGTIVLPNGTKILPDGSKLLIDGTIVYPDGTIRKPSNNKPTENTGENDTNNSNIVETDENDVIDSNE
ncbi:penicillin-binding protein 1A [Maledivibacter halophilus]|uniref:Penicillin-binding protein 1A n=1 Tax=Maledivibacter halophilus TaxID=36842 RepID=A0A1T5MU06_9FIRM|nr:transglycosylase domain-containing protein [Maledivibacter halophilus]SKC91513.1 penicillin-binding protein 1A [Maledivibacter halophilus]